MKGYLYEGGEVGAGIILKKNHHELRLLVNNWRKKKKSFPNLNFEVPWLIFFSSFQC